MKLAMVSLDAKPYPMENANMTPPNITVKLEVIRAVSMLACAIALMGERQKDQIKNKGSDDAGRWR